MYLYQPFKSFRYNTEARERNFPFNRVAEPVLSAVEGFKSLIPIKIGEGDPKNLS